ncbi:MAG: arylesterase [Cyclobacteriaceae bacterium]
MKIKILTLIALLTTAMACQENSENTQRQGNAANEIADSTSAAQDGAEKATILFFGNSLTAGYGVETEEAFPALIQNKIDSLELDYKTVNAGVSGETTAGGLARIDWVLDRYDPDVFVLELGANDGLRGQSLDEAEDNLQKIMDKVREDFPDVRIVLAGMMIPPNYGREYAENFSSMYQRLADNNDLELIPFLLDGVGGNPGLNQDDGIHPTVEGHKIVAENVWEILRPVVMQEAENTMTEASL